ncbi:TPA: penicillin-binding protein 2, partial [Bacillus cereus]|nr:penicillin-binding protein 2 [Bacillus cereus]
DDKNGINSIIGKEVLDVYFDLKQQRIHGEATSTGSSKQN